MIKFWFGGETREQGTGNREQEWRLARSVTTLTCRGYRGRSCRPEIACDFRQICSKGWSWRGKQVPRQAGDSPRQIRISPPAPVQSSPASLAPGLDRRTGMAWIRWAWPGRSRGLAGPAVPLHTHHQIPTVVHTQQHLGRLPRAAGVFDRHPATGAFIRQAPHPTARRAEHRHPHAVVLASAIAPHPGIQRHVFIIHIHNAFPSPRRACRCGDIVTLGSISSLCRWKTLRSD